MANLDWSAAQLTRAAKNALKPGESNHHLRRVIRVPRESLSHAWPLSWSDLEDATARGELGAEPWLILGGDLAPSDTAYLREGDNTVTLKGRSLLFSQGW